MPAPLSCAASAFLAGGAGVVGGLALCALAASLVRRLRARSYAMSERRRLDTYRQQGPC